MKRKITILVVLLLVCLTFTACTKGIKNDQLIQKLDILEDNLSVEDPAYNLDAILCNIGKTLSEIKKEYPLAEFSDQLNPFPDASAACLVIPGAEYSYCFFGGQSGDFKKAMDECEDQLKCAGIVTTAGVLFPQIHDNITFSEFFSLIDVTEYTYFDGEEATVAEGWLSFIYNGMDVWLNTNEVLAGGGSNFTGDEKIRINTPVSIIHREIFNKNQELADTIIFN